MSRALDDMIVGFAKLFFRIRECIFFYERFAKIWIALILESVWNFLFFFFKSNLYYKYRESLAKVSLNESALEEPRSS